MAETDSDFGGVNNIVDNLTARFKKDHIYVSHEHSHRIDMAPFSLARRAD
jgi:hypothetical protein